MTWNDIKYFRPSEFACRCGQCDSDGREMSIDFVWKLDQLRERLGFPIVVTSGYRCPAYNAQISTTGDDGPHTTGRAADVSLAGRQAFRMLQQATLGGWFTGIGLRQHGPHSRRFMHLDDLTEPGHAPRPWVWTYPGG